MYMVVRNYAGHGAAALFDRLEQSEDEVKALISTVPGFISYAAARTGDDSGVTVTVCESKAGTDESSRRAAGWVQENLAGGGSPPKITQGETIMHF